MVHDVASPVSMVDAAALEIVPEAVTSLIARWNEAHVKHDTAALAALYADTVYFYGKTLSRAECTRLKSEAFGKAADYTQVTKGVTVSERGDRWVAKLTKAWTASGRTTETPTVLYLDKHGHITAEMDRPNDHWCMGPYDEPNGVVIAPFTISASAARAHLMRSQYREDLAGGSAYTMMYSCPDPTQCASGVVRTTGPQTDEDKNCYFGLRMGAASPAMGQGSDPNRPPILGHMWFDLGTWTDGVTNVFWFSNGFSDGGETWQRDPRN